MADITTTDPSPVWLRKQHIPSKRRFSWGSFEMSGNLLKTRKLITGWVREASLGPALKWGQGWQSHKDSAGLEEEEDTLTETTMSWHEINRVQQTRKVWLSRYGYPSLKAFCNVLAETENPTEVPHPSPHGHQGLGPRPMDSAELVPTCSGSWGNPSASPQIPVVSAVTPHPLSPRLSGSTDISDISLVKLGLERKQFLNLYLYIQFQYLLNVYVKLRIILGHRQHRWVRKVITHHAWLDDMEARPPVPPDHGECTLSNNDKGTLLFQSGSWWELVHITKVNRFSSSSERTASTPAPI